MPSCFVTGTDTGVGKTVIAEALLHHWAAGGHRVAGYKPVAAGCDRIDGIWQNEDARRLRAASSVALTYEDVNPHAFAPPIAPHLAARQAGVAVTVSELARHYHRLAERADMVVVEGAGGWLVPLNETETLADLAEALQLPVVIVVGVRLGCLNHALLTWEAVRARGLPVLGWVANAAEGPYELFDANVTSLQSRLSAPLLGVVPWQSELVAARVVACLQGV